MAVLRSLNPDHFWDTQAGGILLRLLATGLFAVMTLFVRLASFEAPVGQIVFWRSAVALVPILMYMAVCGDLPSALYSRRPVRLLLRSVLGCLAMFASFISLSYLPLSQASALTFLTPIFVSLGGIIVFRERPTWLLAAAIVGGFMGVLVILWEKLLYDSMNSLSWIGVIAGVSMAVLSALARLQIKELTKTERAATIAFYFALFCAVGGASTWFLGWQPHNPTVLPWLIGAGISGGLAHIAMTEAIARAPISVLAPFEYSAIVWVLMFDVIFFGEDMSWLGLAGTGIILAASLLYFCRKPS